MTLRTLAILVVFIAVLAVIYHFLIPGWNFWTGVL